MAGFEPVSVAVLGPDQRPRLYAEIHPGSSWYSQSAILDKVKIRMREHNIPLALVVGTFMIYLIAPGLVLARHASGEEAITLHLGDVETTKSVAEEHYLMATRLALLRAGLGPARRADLFVGQTHSLVQVMLANPQKVLSGSATGGVAIAHQYLCCALTQASKEKLHMLAYDGLWTLPKR